MTETAKNFRPTEGRKWHFQKICLSKGPGEIHVPIQGLVRRSSPFSHSEDRPESMSASSNTISRKSSSRIGGGGDLKSHTALVRKLLQNRISHKFPPTPHRVLQGGGVVEGAYTFRFLNLKARASYSMNWMGSIPLFGSRRSRAKVYYSTTSKGNLVKKEDPWIPK